MDMPIKDLLAEQKKLDGKIDVVKKTLDMIVDREYKRFMAELDRSKHITVTQDQADLRARAYVKNCIVGSGEPQTVNKLYIENMIVT